MPTGYTTTGSLADSLPTVISAARIVRETTGVITKQCDRQTLGKGIGKTWNEISLAQLTAQGVTESTNLEDNPQQLSDSLLTITPTMVGISTFITDLVAQRISPKTVAKWGSLAQNAMERKKAQDGVTTLDGATTSLCGTGTTFASGYITAAASRIRANTTENGPEPIVAVLHEYQIKDIADEIVAGVGTYPVPAGMTEQTFRNGFKGEIGNVMVYGEGNITADSTPDVKGGVYSREALILVQGIAPRQKTERKEGIGGGGTMLYLYDEYAWGERSAGNWLFEMMADATAPTS